MVKRVLGLFIAVVFAAVATEPQSNGGAESAVPKSGRTVKSMLEEVSESEQEMTLRMNRIVSRVRTAGVVATGSNAGQGES